MHRRTVGHALGALALLAAPALVTPARAQNGAVYVQCPGDSNGDSIPDVPTLDTNGDGVPDAMDPHVKCMHLSAGDGFVTMADGRPLYIFGFSDITGTLTEQALDAGALSANFPAPTVRLREGDHFYLNLTNVGMNMRPDLSDPHSVHFHGFPQAAPVFDGTPENSIAVNMGSSLSYYYQLVEPGTYMYHCHVEATEHMQMGMLGNLYVEPRQNQTGCPAAACPTARLEGGAAGAPLGYAYNDGDGSTGYDVEYPIQIGSFDPNFHDASESVQPLPFGNMDDRYPMLNGRGYPDTVNTAVLSTETDRGPKPSQPVHSLIRARAGERILLRISNLNVTRFYTLGSTIPMKVVGHNARLHRGPSGTDLYYRTNSVTLGGGEAVDVLLETAGMGAGTHLLYTTNLNYLSNDGEDLGGMMTEIRLE
ncbi:MAG TPA: multicopper oxidase domain-containing protein [Vicinamibacteria bacterium]|jgi:FtsP/CotA-like multicopper oxidase with cupredoxin domain